MRVAKPWKRMGEDVASLLSTAVERFALLISVVGNESLGKSLAS